MRTRVILFALVLRVSSLFAISVCIDPGHGGSDPGAVGPSLEEKSANLWVALSCRDYLQGVSGVSIGLTRDSDVSVSLAARCEYANSGGFDRFMSIHHNAYNGTVQGTETYRHTTQSADSPAGRFQAAVHPWLIWAFGYYDRGRKQADFYVLRNTVMPAILGEASFIDYNVDYDESWRFATNWNDHIGREGYAWAKGFCDMAGLSIRDYGTPESLVIDDGDPGWVATGSWNVTSTGGYRDDYRWTETNIATDYCTYTPNIPVGGYYRVYIWYREGTNRSNRVTIEIAYSGGADRLIINQQIQGRQWNYLGTFRFAQGSSGYVRITDDGSPPGYVVIADAVKWVFDSPLQIEKPLQKSGLFSLGKNFPNPFNAYTYIPFTLFEPASVEFAIFNITGERVYLFGPVEYQSGEHILIWDGRGSAGVELPSGVYFGNVRTGSEIRSIKMILEK